RFRSFAPHPAQGEFCALTTRAANGLIPAEPELMKLFIDSADVAQIREAWSWGIKPLDRKSTRLNSSHVANSYAVFCLKKKTGRMDNMLGRSFATVLNILPHTVVSLCWRTSECSAAPIDLGAHR